MKTIRVNLEKPIPLLSLRDLSTEIKESASRRYGLKIDPMNPASLLGTIRWTGPVEKFGNKIKLVEAYEALTEPSGIPNEPHVNLHTFYGSTIPLNIGSLGTGWENHLKEKGIEETRAYFIEQVGETREVADFWRGVGRNWLPNDSQKTIEYGATPIAEPFDFIIYPHPEEVGCPPNNYYNERFLRYSLDQKENVRVHLENVLGRKIEIKESLAKHLLKTLEGE